MAKVKVLKTKEPVLTKKGKKLFDDFDEAAQDWGREQDQGCINVASSMEAHDDARLALMKYISRLEKMNKFLRKQFKEKAEKEFQAWRNGAGEQK